ncbi:MAG: hypothetical protein K8I60_10920, partial [Anaerolineae bacterium]|nr:hypothetical protein [Anaerolineae bacterium]
VLTPAYATLTAFGLSCLFAYCFVRGFQGGKRTPQLLAGVFGGLLVLTRLETVLIAGVVVLALAVMREFHYLRHYILGGLGAVVILIGYNVSQFGTPFYTDILNGDINELTFNGGYILASLVSPQAGMVFWSTLTTLGIIGLFLDTRRYTRILGLGSLALIALVLVRVPVMYLCIGEGAKMIGGLPVSCLNDTSDALMLIQSDTNRYITVLIPFAVIGLRTWIAYLPRIARRFSVRMSDA